MFMVLRQNFAEDFFKQKITPNLYFHSFVS